MLDNRQDYHDSAIAHNMSDAPHIFTTMFALDDYQKTMVMSWTGVFWCHPMWLEGHVGRVPTIKQTNLSVLISNSNIDKLVPVVTAVDCGFNGSAHK